MQRITSPRELARKAVGTARELLQKLEDAYRAKRTASQPAPAPVRPAPPPAPAPTPTPTKPPKTTNWELRSQAEIVEHIESHYHAGLRRDLPALTGAARRLEREHAGNPAFPAGLADHLDAFAASLDSHMLKEENVLFPILRGGNRGGPVDMPIRMMMREHDDHAADLERMHELTADLTPPADASPAWRELYAGLETLERDLREHIYLENNVLFARATGDR